MEATQYSQVDGFQTVKIDEKFCPWPETSSGHSDDFLHCRGKGWEHFDSVRLDDTGVDAWSTNDPEWAAVVSLDTYDRGWVLVFRSQADLMAYWHQYVLSLAMGHNVLREIREILSLRFQADHGHSFHTICAHCNPDAWRHDQKWERIRRAATAKGWAKDQTLDDFMKEHGMKEHDYV